MRILFLAYSHVDFAAGGAQQMASEMSRAADAAGHRTHLIAALEEADAEKVFLEPGALMPAPGRPGLSFFHPTHYDADLFSSEDVSAYQELRAFIGRFRPDVVHFHHFHRLGVEAIVAARLAAPKALISLTFHEMMAICPANGLMLKAPGRTICGAASPVDCAQCLPGREPESLAWREKRLRTALGFCDQFVFPSRFVAELHIAWGLDPAKASVIPNGVAHPLPGFDRSRRSDMVNHFGFFGQMIDHKGVDVVLEALLWLAKERRIPAAGVEFQLHGANRHYASPEFLERVDALSAEVERLGEGRIRVIDLGPYGRADLARRMADVDWVVTPSTWGENYPLVVSEAWMFGRPVIATAVGGLAERIRNGVDGFTFPLRDAAALGRLIFALSGNDVTWKRLNAAIEPPLTPEEMLEGYMQLWTEPLG